MGSEELRQRGYVKEDGTVVGREVGPYEGFSIGATTVGQLAKAGVLAKTASLLKSKLKPDLIVVDRRTAEPRVLLVVDAKDLGELGTAKKQEAALGKVAKTYCRLLNCELGAVAHPA